VLADKPLVNIYEFKGTFYSEVKGEEYREPLRLNNTMWTDTVLASGEIYGLVIYTGKESRKSMNLKNPQMKVGMVDLEINVQGKILFCLMIILTLTGLMFSGFGTDWVIKMFRFFILLTSIIPISLRVNLDLAKLVYSIRITRDQEIKGTVARNSNIPEELGRIQYLYILYFSFRLNCKEQTH
jgi:phospholipid-translocating ATPase